MEIKIKLPIPYSKYDLTFEYRKLISLTELESLIIILVFCKNKGEINKTNKLVDALKEKYNLNSSFQDLFETNYMKLLRSGAIIAYNDEEKFSDVLIGNLDLNKDVELYLGKEKFWGMKEEPIYKNETYISNLILKNGINILSNNFDEVKVEDDKALLYFRDENEKINGNYDNYFDIEANKEKNKKDNAYKTKKFTSNEIKINSYENIFFRKEEVIFHYDDGSLYSTDNISEEIIKLFSNNIFYKDFPSIIKSNIETKIISPNTNDNLAILKDDNIDKKLLIIIKENIYYILDNKIVQLFNKRRELSLNDFKNTEPISYNVLCKKDFDDYSDIINELLINVDKNLLIDIYKKVNVEIKREIINKLFANKEFLTNNLEFIKSELEDCLKELKKIPLIEITKLLKFDDDLFLDILKSDSTKREFIQQLKTCDISRLLHIKIIEIYRLSYDGNSYYLLNSSLEKEINNFYNEYQFIQPHLENYKKFKLKLTNYKDLNSEINFVFRLLDENLNSSIKELELQNEEKIKESCILIAQNIRGIVEPLAKSLGMDGKIVKEFADLIKDLSQRQTFIEKWNFNHQWLHGKIKKNQFNRNNLKKLEENKEFFEKTIDEIKNNINRKERGK